MKTYDVIGYAYDADSHCLDCTVARFPEADAEFTGCEDTEGNGISPIFADGDHDPSGEYCGDCGAELWEPEETIDTDEGKPTDNSEGED